MRVAEGKPMQSRIGCSTVPVGAAGQSVLSWMPQLVGYVLARFPFPPAQFIFGSFFSQLLRP